jgi:hypothetical protein
MAEEIVKKEDEKMLSQMQVDAIVQERLSRERAKFSDYDDLRKFKTEFEKTQDAKQLQLLEEQKKYQEAKDTYEKKINEFQGVISKKDLDIKDMRISGLLMTEITKQNAYAEETMALLKSQAEFDKEGNIRIKGRDAKFLASRPHLVKAANRAGGGTAAGSSSAGAGTGANDLAGLNEEFAQAQSRGDYKMISEVGKKIKIALAAQGVRR